MKKTLLYLLISSFVFYLPSSIFHLTSFLYSYPPGWSDDILLTPEDDKNRMQPDIDVDTYNNVWAVWDSGSWVNNTAEILYSKRDSLGACLIPETDVSNNASYSIGPRIAVDASNNIQFVWRDETPQGMGIWHATLASDGSVIVPSHLAVSGNNDGFPINIALNKHKEINVIWDEVSGCNQMNYTKLDSLGNPIIAKIRVSLENIYAYWPGIGVDSFANNHMAYRSDSGFQDRLTYTKLDKDGNILIDNNILDTGLLPTIIADRSQNIHMVYSHPTGSGWSIEYLKLSNNGSILISPKTISIHEHNMSPHMAMDSLQYMHVVWHLEDPQGIMYTKLDTLGDFIISPIMVVYPPDAVWPAHPRIAVDYSNRLHLVWKDQRFNPGVSTDIFYKRGENDNTVEEMSRLKTANLPGITVFPNPFKQMTEIRYQIPEGVDSRQKSVASMKIFDASGRLVRSFPIINLCNPNKSVVSVYWAGTDDFGNHLPAGIYFIRLSNFTDAQSVPVILLR